MTVRQNDTEVELAQAVQGSRDRVLELLEPRERITRRSNQPRSEIGGTLGGVENFETRAADHHDPQVRQALATYQGHLNELWVFLVNRYADRLAGTWQARNKWISRDEAYAETTLAIRHLAARFDPGLRGGGSFYGYARRAIHAHLTEWSKSLGSSIEVPSKVGRTLGHPDNARVQIDDLVQAEREPGSVDFERIKGYHRARVDAADKLTINPTDAIVELIDAKRGGKL